MDRGCSPDDYDFRAIGILLSLSLFPAKAMKESLGKSNSLT